MAIANTQAKEVTFAYRLLSYLHANFSNVYLLLAIVAWVRSESGTHYIGNNPLNIRNSPYASGFRQYKGNGHFAIFANLDTAAKATAYFLTHNRGYGYENMVTAARRAAGTAAQTQQRQAIDFMMGLVISKWDAGHYGLTGTQLQDPNALYGTTLYRVWSGLLGHPVTIPASAKPKPPKAKPKPPPKAKAAEPRGPVRPPPVHEYLDPFAARHFYDERHSEFPVVPGAPLDG